MSKKRMLTNALMYGFCGVGCCLAGGVMFCNAEIFIKALKEEGDN